LTGVLIRTAEAARVLLFAFYDFCRIGQTLRITRL